MAVLDDLTLGQHLAGNSLLHRVDPRLKLAGTALLVIAVFSGTDPARLLLLGSAALALAVLSGVGLRRWWRGIRALRWLFFFSILLHLLFSPGRTLWGIEWLSLDGLTRGMAVSVQMVLAVVFSSLLTFTTTPQGITAAFARLCSPLCRFRVPVEEGARLLLLILHFIPLLREEAAAALSAVRSRGGERSGRFQERLLIVRQAVPSLVLRLVERADELAHACARGEKIPGEEVVLPPLKYSELLCVAAISLFSFSLMVLL